MDDFWIYYDYTKFIIICYSVVKSASVYQMNQDIQQGRAPKTIIRIDPARPELYDRFIHAHFSDGGALYTNGQWKHGGRLLTNAELNWLRANGWDV